MGLRAIFVPFTSESFCLNVFCRRTWTLEMATFTLWLLFILMAVKICCVVIEDEASV